MKTQGDFNQYEKRIISISMSVDVLAKLDDYAKKCYMNRSAAINSLLVQALDQNSAIDIMGRLLDKMDKYEKIQDPAK